MTSEQHEYLGACRARYASDLADDILPFWIEHGLDREHGGIYTCLDRDGTRIDGTKSVWFQGRFAYICAAAYRHAGQNPEWLEAGRSALDFIERHCIDTDGHMFFTVTAEGSPVQKRRYVFSECFAAMALAEYAAATNDGSYAAKAMEMFRNILRMLSTPGFLEPKTLIPTRGHSITMMLINVAQTVRQVVSDPLLDERIEASIDEIERYFMHPEFGTILETVGPNGEFLDTCAGRTINPGHCMETAWFLLDAARTRGGDARRQRKTVETALTVIDWAWKWGWDEPYGGIINFRDCRNFPPQDYAQDMKFWWPQCETILATLHAYAATGDEKYLAMHRKVHDYAFRCFPDAACGEWYGYLHRDGTVAQPAKGNLFKGPFHVPRMMLLATLLCDEILSRQP